uniref:G-protein coupled receptors family 1 profile domain-containing protein n=1 Tax=Plectus sambesii TaxID=2011161 RepID=A0A914V889_9BILA
MECNATYYNNASLANIINIGYLQMSFGSLTAATNILCMLVVLSTKQMSRKYGNFGLLSLGGMLNALGLILAGSIRKKLIYDNSYGSLSSFACFGRPWPYFFIVGGQLPAFVLIVMAGERVIAIFKPIIYRTYVTPRIRVITDIICIILSILSLLIGIFFSYLNRDICTNPTCTTVYATGRLYGTFNNFFIVLLPFIALLLNTMAYIGAKRLSVSTNMERELKKVLVSLMLAALAVVLSALPNIIIWGQGVYWNVVIAPYMNMAFCSNSAVNLFAFFFMRKDFRYRLLSFISFGYLNRYFKLSEVIDTKARQNMVQSIGNNQPARS